MAEEESTIIFDETTLQGGDFSQTEPYTPGSKFIPSTSNGRSMKDLEEQLNQFKKENFNLKLRIYFAEERQKILHGVENTDDLVKTIMKLQTDNSKLKTELCDKDDLILQSAKAMESLEKGHENQKIETKRLHEIYVKQLHNKIEQLEQELTHSKFREDANSNDNVVRELENKVMYLESKLSDARLMIANLEAEISKPSEEIRSMSDHIAELQTELMTRNSRLGEVYAQVRQAKQEREQCEEEIQSLKNEITRLERSLQNAQHIDSHRASSPTSSTSQLFINITPHETEHRLKDLQQKYDQLNREHRKLCETFSTTCTKLEKTDAAYQKALLIIQNMAEENKKNMKVIGKYRDKVRDLKSVQSHSGSSGYEGGMNEPSTGSGPGRGTTTGAVASGGAVVVAGGNGDVKNARGQPEGSNEVIREEFSEKDIDLLEKQVMIEDYAKQLVELNHKLHQYESQIFELNAKIQQYENDSCGNTDLALQLKSKTEEIERLNSELKKRTFNLQELVNTELWGKNKEIEKLNKKSERKQCELNNLKQIVKEKENHLIYLQKEMNDIWLEIVNGQQDDGGGGGDGDDVSSPSLHKTLVQRLNIFKNNIDSVAVDKYGIVQQLDDAKLSLSICDKERREAINACYMLTKGLEDLAQFLEGLLSSNELYSLSAKKKSIVQQAIDSSRELSRNFSITLNNSSIVDDVDRQAPILPDNSGINFSSESDELADVTLLEPPVDAADDVTNTPQTRIIRKLRLQVDHLKHEVKQKDMKIAQSGAAGGGGGGDLSPCEAFSEPDLTVSKARMGNLVSVPSGDLESDEDDNVRCKFKGRRHLRHEKSFEVTTLQEKLDQLSKINDQLEKEKEFLQEKLGSIQKADEPPIASVDNKELRNSSSNQLIEEFKDQKENNKIILNKLEHLESIYSVMTNKDELVKQLELYNEAKLKVLCLESEIDQVKSKNKELNEQLNNTNAELSKYESINRQLKQEMDEKVKRFEEKCSELKEENVKNEMDLKLKLKENENALKNEIENNKLYIERLKLELENKKLEINKQNELFQQMKASIEKSNQEVYNLNKAIQTKTEEIEAKSKEIEELVKYKEENRQFEQHLNQYKEENESKMNKSFQDIESLSETIKTQSNEIQMKNKEIEELQKQKEDLEKVKEETQRNFENFKDQINQLKIELERSNVNLDHAQETITELKENITQKKTINEILKDKNNKFQNKVNLMENNKMIWERDINALRVQLQKYRENEEKELEKHTKLVEEMKKRIDEFKCEKLQLRTEIQDLRRKIEEMVRDKEELVKEYEEKQEHMLKQSDKTLQEIQNENKRKLEMANDKLTQKDKKLDHIEEIHKVQILEKLKGELEKRVNELELSNVELEKKLTIYQKAPPFSEDLTSGGEDHVYPLSPRRSLCTPPQSPSRNTNLRYPMSRQHSQDEDSSYDPVLLGQIPSPLSSTKYLSMVHNFPRDNSSPDLGIDSDHGRISTSDVSENQPNKSNLSKLMEENEQLQKMLYKTRQALENTIKQLAAANRRKCQIERDICKQLHKTQHIIRKARVNIQCTDTPEADPAHENDENIDPLAS